MVAKRRLLLHLWRAELGAKYHRVQYAWAMFDIGLLYPGHRRIRCIKLTGLGNSSAIPFVGTTFGDCLAAWCCRPCFAHKEHRETKLEKVQRTWTVFMVK